LLADIGAALGAAPYLPCTRKSCTADNQHARLAAAQVAQLSFPEFVNEETSAMANSGTSPTSTDGSHQGSWRRNTQIFTAHQ
jgi:hypothetical protein